MQKILSLSVALAMAALSSSAQKRIYVNEYLNIGVGARGLGMGGAQSASTSDVTAGYWNPAGLSNITNDLQVGLMHAEYFSGNAKYDYLSIAKPLADKKRTVGFSALRFATDDIAYTIDYIQPDGSFDDSKLKSISAGDYAFMFHYSQKVKIFKQDFDDNDDIETSFGVNAKVLYRHIGKMANAWGGGLDFGLQGKYGQWRFGIMAKDITTTTTSWSFHLTEKEKQVFGETGNEIPVKSNEVMLPRLSLGLGRMLSKPTADLSLLAEFNADITTDGKRSTLVATNAFSVDPRLGLEVGYKNIVYVRGGIGNIQRVLDNADTTNTKKVTMMQPSAGLGLRINSLSIDYAFTTLLAQDNPLPSHVVSLRLAITRPDADVRDARRNGSSSKSSSGNGRDPKQKSNRQTFRKR